MNRKSRAWKLMTVPALALGGLGTASCDQVQKASEELCGPCGTIRTGDFSVSGNAQVDGFFQAVGTLQSATAKIQSDFDANIRALAAVYGVTITGAVDGAAVDSVVNAIRADLQANVSGGLKILYKPPQCEASVDVAIQAQAQCEAKANCQVAVQPGQVAVSCQGTCTGSCSGQCSGTLSCAVKAPTVNCQGECEGTCQLSAAATCNGVCHGTCSSGCSATDANGQCNGSCAGTCQGSCELAARGSCTGTCNGTCYVDQGSAQCTASAECSGTCSAECSGKCTGSFTPPSASASCQASAQCQAQAKAQANASIECTPPTFDVSYAFTGTAAGQAAFTARLAELKVRGAAIVQGAARLSALVTGKVNGQVVFSPAPVAQVTTSIEGLVSSGVDGSLDIPKGRIVCLVPAFGEAAQILSEIGGSVNVTIQSQAKFTAVLGA